MSVEGTVEEAVFKLRGILASKDLPPLEETPKSEMPSFIISFLAGKPAYSCHIGSLSHAISISTRQLGSLVWEQNHFHGL
jgi:hypothetical protein